MTADNDKSTGIPLDYGRKQNPWRRAWAGFRAEWSRVRAESNERLEKTWKSVGYFIGMAAFSAGGRKQLILAFGLAFFAGGLGLAIEGSQSSHGHIWMCIGAFLIGLVIPISKPGAGK